VTAAAEKFAVRVMVTDVWDHVVLAVDAGTRITDLKREALTRALKGAVRDLDDYMVKFRGAEVSDELATIESVGATANSSFIVLPVRRRIVR